MKKILLLLFVVSFAFVSCTDNTDENITQLETQSIDKEDATHDGGSGETPSDNDED